MSNEIATYSMILSKLSLGKSGTECPTKTLILAINSLIVIENASTYGANECVKIDDIRKKAETWNYYLTVSPTSMSFGAGGGSKSFTVSSYKRKVLDGVELSGDTSVSLKSTTISGTGFSLSGTTVSASANEITSNRTGTVTITQNESNKTVTINVSQDAKPAEDEYTFEIRKSDEEYTGKTSITFDVPARTVGWSGNYAYRSRKNGEQFANVSFSSSASWLHVKSSGSYTVDHNTGSSSRSGTITLTQAESGLKCYVYINQSGYTPRYTFSVIPTNLGVDAAETNETLTVESYKTVLESDGSETTESLDYEFSSNSDWVNAIRTTINTTYINIAENETTTLRTAKITLTQEESGVQAFTNVIQNGKAEEVVNKLTLNSLTYDNGYLFLSGTIPVESSALNYFMFMANSSLNWYASVGLKVNGGTAYAGNLVDIYVPSRGSYKLVKSFLLQLGEQTVTY